MPAPPFWMMKEVGTGTLTVDDLATEEFPYVTFDGRFKGLWP